MTWLGHLGLGLGPDHLTQTDAQIPILAGYNCLMTMHVWNYSSNILHQTIRTKNQFIQIKTRGKIWKPTKILTGCLHIRNWLCVGMGRADVTTAKCWPIDPHRMDLFCSVGVRIFHLSLYLMNNAQVLTFTIVCFLEKKFFSLYLFLSQ